MRRREFLGIVGGAVAWPAVARALRPVPVIGFLSARTATDSEAVLAAFLRGLGEVDLVEGRDIKMEYRWANGKLDTLPLLAKEMVDQRVALIVAVAGDLPVRAAMSATKSIPIVFVMGNDPVKSGIVSSLNRPDGNATGVTLYSVELEQKKLQLLRELVPAGNTSFGVLLDPKRPDLTDVKSGIENAARSISQPVHFLFASTEVEIDSAFDEIIQTKIGGLMVISDTFFSTHRDQIIRMAARRAVPTIYDSAIQVAEGGLMSYGTSYTETYRQAGIYAARIVKGTKPADLPVLLPTKFELAINLKTAKTLGLSIPPTLLARADEVIE
jgi:putative tryptophan/tyrosine transport system substrate-binding protein